jgi:uncharacterized protein (DUF983 family)
LTHPGSAPKAATAILLGRCPRCGAGSLFAGWLSQAKACSACSLNLSRYEAGDGPAVFAILIVGFLVAGGALLVEVAYQPPYWLHALIWGPAILLLSLGLLRPLKAWLIVSQYRHSTEEGSAEEGRRGE